MAGERVFVDTNVILEAHRVGCWNAICGSFSIETVEKCVRESTSGNPDKPGYIHVSENELRERLTSVHQVSQAEIVKLVLSHSECYVLDDGEQQLLARLYADEILPSQDILVLTPDKAAIIAARELGWLDSWTSLDALAREAGVGRAILRQLRTQYQDAWLSSTKTKVVLGALT
ncbi:hypothetical protein BMS3Abin14_01046 [bacterium BMS3Abin14]|nr:hypothetical protein BMS3Abin14_01046 [bacterium BMS3Abin14]